MYLCLNVFYLIMMIVYGMWKQWEKQKALSTYAVGSFVKSMDPVLLPDLSFES